MGNNNRITRGEGYIGVLIVKDLIRFSDGSEQSTAGGGVGPEGPQGPPGQGLRYVGTWTISSYNTNDVVTYQGNSYVCLNNSPGTTPPDINASWGLMSAKGDTGNPGTNGTNGTAIYDTDQAVISMQVFG